MRAAFDQDAAKAAFGKRLKYGGWCDLAGTRGNLCNFNIRWQRGPDAFGGDDDPPDAVRSENPCVRREPPPRIQNDTSGTRSGDAPDSELRIVRDGRPDADKHRIHQSAQPVQMRQPGGAVDVFGMAGHRRDATVDRLADLSDHDEIVDRPLPQGPT